MTTTNHIEKLLVSDISEIDYKGYAWRIKIESSEVISEIIHEEATVFANNGMGDYLFVKQNDIKGGSPCVFEYWHDDPQVITSEDSFTIIVGFENRRASDSPVPKYATGESMSIGDIIEYKSFFRKKKGEVTYVPGISKKDPNLEFDGISMALFRKENGDQSTLTIDPDTNVPCGYFRLLERQKEH